MRFLIICILFLSFSCSKKNELQSIIKQDGKYGIINLDGDYIVEPYWDDIWSLNEGYYPVKKDSLWGFINTNGEISISPKYAEIGFFSEGFVEVSNFENKWGIINVNGDTLVPLTYDYIFDGFNNGLSDIFK